jgi:hypothetical protein
MDSSEGRPAASCRSAFFFARQFANSSASITYPSVVLSSALSLHTRVRHQRSCDNFETPGW